MACSLPSRALTSATTFASLQDSHPSNTRVNSQEQQQPLNTSVIPQKSRHVSSISQQTFDVSQPKEVPMFLTAGKQSNQTVSQSAGWWNQVFHFPADPWADLLPSNSPNSAKKSNEKDPFLTTYVPKADMHSRRQENIPPIWDQYDSIPTSVKKKVLKSGNSKEERKSEIRNLDWRAVRIIAQKKNRI